jgi:hypothetical protein
MTLFIYLSQVVTIYQGKFYDKEILPDLLIVMISCLIAFNFGFNKEYKLKESLNFDYKISSNIKYLLILFCVSGFIATLMYRQLISGDWVIASFFQSFGLAAGVVAIFLIIKGRRKIHFYYIILILSLYPLIDFALFVKGSRSRAFYVILLVCFLISSIYPSKRKFVKYSFLSLFIVGSIVSASIAQYRMSLKGNSNIESVEFLQNYTNSFIPTIISTNGMDLGNAALGIQYCKKSMNYSMGLIFIDRLIYNYVPARFIGEREKKSMMLSPESAKIEAKYTNSVTTMTGFYEAFNCFSYAGFLLFYFMGLFMKYCWVKASHSIIYFLIYFYLVVYINVSISHGLTYFFSYLFLLLVLILPLLAPFISLNKKYSLVFGKHNKNQ